jgi:cytoskeletal protein CcmA (bactofilin family)
MRKFKIATLLLVAVLGVGVLFGSVASAQSFRSGETVTTSKDETVDSSLFTAGTTITIDSNVNGDVFCAGQTVVISGDVNGDVICAAQTMTISGNVTGDIRLVSQTITLSGNVEGNASIFTSTLVQDSNGRIGGDLSVASSDTTIAGEIGRDVAVGSGSFTLGGSVGRNIEGDLENLVLSSGSLVAGNINFTSINEISQDSDAVVQGEITRKTPEQASGSGSIFGISIAFIAYTLVSALFVSLVLVLLVPRFFHSVTSRAVKSPWKPLLVGLIVTFFAPIVGFLLLITFFGIPLAITLGAGWMFVALLSGPFTAYLVGRWVLNSSTKPVLIMLVGSLVLLVAYFIPVLGFLALLFAYWIGVGMLSLELYSRYPKPSYNFVNVDTNAEKQPKKTTTKKTASKKPAKTK